MRPIIALHSLVVVVFCPPLAMVPFPSESSGTPVRIAAVPRRVVSSSCRIVAAVGGATQYTAFRFRPGRGEVRAPPSTHVRPAVAAPDPRTGTLTDAVVVGLVRHKPAAVEEDTNPHLSHRVAVAAMLSASGVSVRELRGAAPVDVVPTALAAPPGAPRAPVLLDTTNPRLEDLVAYPERVRRFARGAGHEVRLSVLSMLFLLLV